MSDPQAWTDVDAYVESHLVGVDPDLEAATREAEAGGLPPIAVSPPQGKLLYLLAKSIGAGRILEIGTLGGFSTIWMARALPADGRLVTLELDSHHAEVARRNLERAGVGGRVEVRVGPALETLPTLEDQGPFDLVFIDADKANIPAYFDWSVRLGHSGTVIITDNVVRNGGLADPTSTDANVKGVQAFHEMLAQRDDVEATTIQTVGSKGWDGYNYAVVS
ncbi:MAG TPA: O-methyltransferase [Acidimicrobiales bacterium]|nr:O-methyltransferase [Acidimicrobiales bacterium]